MNCNLKLLFTSISLWSFMVFLLPVGFGALVLFSILGILIGIGVSYLECEENECDMNLLNFLKISLLTPIYGIKALALLCSKL